MMYHSILLCLKFIKARLWESENRYHWLWIWCAVVLPGKYIRGSIKYLDACLHWCRVVHYSILLLMSWYQSGILKLIEAEWRIYASVNFITIINSDNGLSPCGCHAMIWTNAVILLIGPLGTNFNGILFEIHIISFMKIHLKMSSGKCRPFCLGLSVLISWIYTNPHWRRIAHCLLKYRPAWRIWGGVQETP